jgi:hypothetical protein
VSQPIVGLDTFSGTVPVGAEPGEGDSRRVLLVLGAGVHTTYPLGPRGRVSIGRGSDNLVAIDDPTISRHHIRIHLGPTLRVEDLGSSNGTRVGRKKLAPNETVDLAPGETVEIGSAVLIVQESRREAPPRRLASWDYFEARIEEAIRRARRLDRAFVILHLRTDRSTATIVERRLAGLLPQLDAVARDVPGEFSALLVDADELDAATAQRWLGAALEDDRVRVAIGHAVYPDDGQTVDELTTCAVGRATGVDEPVREVDEPIAADPASKRLFRLIERVSTAPLHVLVVGESGSGKTVTATQLHRRSGADPVVEVDCGVEDLDESMFAEGGPLERARGGVLVLDRLCSLPVAVQERLVAQLDRDERSGGGLGVRVVAMESRDVEAEIEAGRLRRDLYFMLHNMVLEVPPLRRRPGDIEPLARRFAEEAATVAGRGAPELSSDTVELLVGHVWPGNVRELRNVMRRAVALSNGIVITPRDLPVEKLTAPFVADRSDRHRAAPQLFDEVRREREAIERQRIVDALDRSAGNQTEAARLLGISRRTLINRLEAYGLPRPRKGR